MKERDIIMIKSKTKFSATNEEVIRMFEANNMPRIKTIETLGNGEFNAAFKVCTEENKEYVVKIAPPRDSKVLTYENNMMESEVFWYEQMREKTDICIPEVYASDFSQKIIPASYFIMEKMDGKPLWEMGFSETEYAKVQEQKIDMLTQIHRIHNHLFGYRQTGLHNSWYEAIRGMVSNLIKDCEAMGIETPNGHKLLMAIDKHEDLLGDCECCMVNFDLWDSNVLYHNGKLCWIDPERSFWGDRIADFITLGKGQKSPLSEKLAEIETYNRTAKTPIVYDKNMEIRYQVAVGYLALIEEVEKYVRYEPEEENYIRNTVDAEAMFEMAFGVLL